MLQNLLVSGGTYNYGLALRRWTEMGQAVDPLFKSVPEAALKDDRLYEYLALVDAG